MIKAIEGRAGSNLKSIKIQNRMKPASLATFDMNWSSSQSSAAFSSNFHANQRINSAKNISFAGEKININEIPEDWYFLSPEYGEPKILEKYPECNPQFQNPRYMEDNQQLFRDYIKVNKGTWIHFEELIHDGSDRYSPLKHRKSGYIYIAKDGSLELERKTTDEVIDRLLEPENMDSVARNRLLTPEVFREKLIERGRIDDAVETCFDEKFREFYNVTTNGCPDDTPYVLACELASEGRIDDAINYFPEVKCRMLKHLRNIGMGYLEEEMRRDELATSTKSTNVTSSPSVSLLKQPKTKEASVPFDFSEGADAFQEWVQEQAIYAKNRAEALAEGPLSKYKFWGKASRPFAWYDHITTISTNEKNMLSESYNRIQGAYHKVIGQVIKPLLSREKSVESTRGSAIRELTFEKERQNLIIKLQEKLLNPILMAQNSRSAEAPNCVILTGENPYIMKGVIDWAGKHSGCNFVIIKYNPDNKYVQDTLEEELLNAKDDFENNNGKRTLIFVESMYKLLNLKISSEENIKQIGKTLECANKDYHSTVVFYATDPSKLDSRVVESDKVRLKIIDIPSIFNDANLSKFGIKIPFYDTKVTKITNNPQLILSPKEREQIVVSWEKELNELFNEGDAIKKITSVGETLATLYSKFRFDEKNPGDNCKELFAALDAKAKIIEDNLCEREKVANKINMLTRQNIEKLNTNIDPQR